MTSKPVNEGGGVGSMILKRRRRESTFSRHQQLQQHEGRRKEGGGGLGRVKVDKWRERRRGLDPKLLRRYRRARTKKSKSCLMKNWP